MYIRALFIVLHYHSLMPKTTSSKSNQSQSTRTKRPDADAVSIAKAKKIKQERITKYVRKSKYIFSVVGKRI